MLIEIAKIPIEIRALPASIEPWKDCLTPFHTTGIRNIKRAEITIEFIPEIPDKRIFLDQFERKLQQPYVVCTDNSLIFSFPSGQFVADLNFTEIKLWFPYKKHPEDDDFARFIWLLFVLWGRISVTGGCFLHGALLVIDDHYLLTLGQSGVGKSTLSRLANEAGFTKLTEENPFLTVEENEYWVHASPWPGMAGPAFPPSGRLDALFFLKHDTNNSVKKLTPFDAGIRLIKNTRMFNWLPNTIPAGISLINDTVLRLPAYEFGFVPDKTAISTIRKIL